MAVLIVVQITENDGFLVFFFIFFWFFTWLAPKSYCDKLKNKLVKHTLRGTVKYLQKSLKTKEGSLEWLRRALVLETRLVRYTGFTHSSILVLHVTRIESRRRSTWGDMQLDQKFTTGRGCLRFRRGSVSSQLICWWIFKSAKAKPVAYECFPSRYMICCQKENFLLCNVRFYGWWSLGASVVVDCSSRIL